MPPPSARAVPGLDGLDGLSERAPQLTLAYGPDHEPEQPSLDVLALAHLDHVHLGGSVGLLGKRVGEARIASPDVGVGGLEDDAVGIGPVVAEALPDAIRPFRDVGMIGTLVVHLEVTVGA